ncbi:hypothetical protein FB446DRAFT_756563 [Lentinula raphanica]|nr:hypothetical protein FB446DRAFT_756563 [Lentinula raphanica]
MTRSLASRSTTSRAVAILILGAALSSGVVAAPTRSPLVSSSIGARDLQSQSSSDGLGTLFEGPIRNLTTIQLSVPRQNGDGLTIDDLEHGRSDPGNVLVAVKLNIRTEEETYNLIYTPKAKIDAKEAYLKRFVADWNALKTEEFKKNRLQLIEGLIAEYTELNDLESLEQWGKIADWIRKQLADADAKYNTIKPQLDAILDNRLGGRTRRKKDIAALIQDYGVEAQWMASLSTVALRLNLCDKDITGRYQDFRVFFT